MESNTRRDAFTPHPASFILYAIVGACCALPVVWIVWSLALNPTAWSELRLDTFRLHLIGRTMLYNAGVAAIAVGIAIPAALTLGRGRGAIANGLWFALPVSLLLPSLTFAYGWKQLLRLLNLDFDPAGFADVSRCVWSLATWLWPIPAVVMGLALRRVDANLQQQALLDGALWRVTARQLVGPAVASMAVVAMLAMQEFAVYEPTGISVVATETRMVFETGAFSSPDNPITQFMSNNLNLTDQPARAAAAVAVNAPVLVAVIVLSIVALLGVRKLGAHDSIEVGDWPRSLDAGTWTILASWSMVWLALGVPLVALFLSLKRRFDPQLIWAEFGPQVFGSTLVASLAGAVVMMLALAACAKRSRVATWVAVASFLVGGQLVAIALIRAYNRPWLTGFYEGPGVITMAYVARFGWIVLAAAGATWSVRWRELRDLAAVDGANDFRTARHVIWPIAWPILLAAALFVAALSLSEVPATVLVSPQRPQLLVPLLMTWVHMLRYDAMIEASLLTAGVVLVVGIVAVVLARFGLRFMSKGQGQTSNAKGAPATRAFHFCLLTFALCLLTCCSSGCDPTNSPDAVWLDTGIGPGQVVYPRGIAYSKSDDTFFIVDRAAHVQHLDRDGKFIADWHMPLSQQGKPVGLTVGPDGNLYVPDTHYHRVIIFSPTGQILREFGRKGMGPGEFIYPTDIAFDGKGNLFVSEYGDNDRVQVFDGKDGRFLYQFGKFGDGPGEFSRPQSMVIDGDDVYITDACNHRIAVFKTDGTFVRNMGRAGSALGEFRFPYGMDMDREGDLIVSEFGNSRVQKIDKRTGAGKKSWGSPGREPGRLAYSWGVCVDKRDRVVAVDAGNNRVQVFEF